MNKTNILFDGDDIEQSKLPKPVGWRLLIGSVRINEMSAGGIILTDETKDQQKFGRFVGRVLAVGDDCYNNEKFQGSMFSFVWKILDLFLGLFYNRDRYKSGIPKLDKNKPWVKVGDFVIVGQYAGQQIPLFNKDGDVVSLKLLNDDEVLAVVDEEYLDTIVIN